MTKTIEEVRIEVESEFPKGLDAFGNIVNIEETINERFNSQLSDSLQQQIKELKARLDDLDGGTE